MKFTFSVPASILASLGIWGVIGMAFAGSLQPSKELSVQPRFKSPLISEKVRQEYMSKNASLVDAEVVRFEKTIEGLEYIKKKGRLTQDEAVDEWGYPQRITFFRSRIYEEKIPQKSKSSQFKKWLNSSVSTNSSAEELDPSMPGMIRCRDNANVQSYFKAYFEELVGNNGASTGQGYADPIKGPARRQAVCEVLKEIAGLLKFDQSNTPIVPDILFAKFSNTIPPGVLAAASAYFSNNINNNMVDSGSLHQHIVSGQNPTPTNGYFDAIVFTNFSQANQWSIDSSLNANTYDFKTVMRHELAHALGFSRRLPEVVSPGTSQVIHNHFVEFFYEKSPSFNTNRFFYIPTVQTMTPVFQVPPGAHPTWYKNESVVYRGVKNIPNAPLGDERPVFSPSSWMGGSSLAHFVSSPAQGVQYVMNAFATKGIALNYHAHELEVFCHLGYRVNGVAGCEGATPIARDDFVLMTTPSQCLNFMDNDQSFVNSFLLKVHKFETMVAPPLNAMTFYTSSNCSSGSETVTVQNAKSIKYTSPISAAFKYSLLDTQTNRISEPALITFSTCQTTPGELVCNGDFEMGPTPGANLGYEYNHAFAGNPPSNNPKVPFWGSAWGSPDLVYKNRPGHDHNVCNLPFQLSVSGAMVNMPTANNNFAALIYSSDNNNNFEKLTTRLREPLQVGQSYVISFHVNLQSASSYNPPVVPTENRALVGFSQNSMQLNTPNSVPFTSAQTIVDQVVPLNLSMWTQVTKTFVATQPHQYIVIHVPQSTNPMIGYFDHVSVKKVGTTEVDSGVISGMVFKDNVIGDGQKQPDEQGLDGVTVGLFTSPNATTPVQVVQSQTVIVNGAEVKGVYSFPQSGSTLQAAANYYVAIIPENNYATISLPATNSIMTGFQHAHQVPFASGGNVTGKDFGVRLNGEAVLNLTWTTMKSCSNMQVNATVTGGQAPYSYQWSNGQSGASVLLPAGVHTLTVTDANGAYTYKTITVADYDFALSAVATKASTQPNSTGKITATVAGGVAPFTYYWAGGNAGGTVGPINSTYNVRSNLPGHPSTTYSVYAKDAKGCQSNTVSGIKVLRQLSIKSLLQRNCNTVPDSSIIAFSAVGGHAPYALQWRSLTQQSPYFPTTPSTSGLLILQNGNGIAPGYGPGLYEMKITDSQNQVAILTREMPTVPTLPFTWTLNQPSSAAASNGSITVNIGLGNNYTNQSGGVYTYQWSGMAPVTTSSPTHTRSNLPVGVYNLTVTMGGTSCETTSKTIYLNGPQLPTGNVQ